MSESFPDSVFPSLDIDTCIDKDGRLRQVVSLEAIVQELRDHFFDYVSIFDDADPLDDEEFEITAGVIQTMLTKHFERSELADASRPVEVIASGETLCLLAPLSEDEQECDYVSLSNTILLQGDALGLTIMDIPAIGELHRLRQEDVIAEERLAPELNHFGLCLVIENPRIIENGESRSPFSDDGNDYIALLPLNYPQLVLKKIIALRPYDRSL